MDGNETRDLLIRIRKEYKLSKSAMADLLMVDRHTYANYEKGIGSPSVANFTALLAELNSKALLIYIDTLRNESGEPLADSKRDALAQFIEGVASEKLVNEIYDAINDSKLDELTQRLSVYNDLSKDDQKIVEDIVHSVYRNRGERDDSI